MSEPRPHWAYTLPTALFLMAPFDILASLAMDIYLPAIPAMPAHLGTTPGMIQLTLSLYMVLLGIGQVVFGPLSDRIGRRPVLLAGATLFTCASLGAALSSSIAVFLLFRVLQAVGASAALVATFATVRDVYGDRPEGATIYGTFSAMLAFVPAIGPIAGAVIMDSLGWRAIFATLAVLTLPALLHAVLRWHETRVAPPGNVRTSIRPILRSPAFWTYVIAFATAMGTFFVFFSIAPRVLIGKAGYSGVDFSLAFASVAVVMIATAAIAGPFVRKCGPAGSVRRGMGLIMLGAALLATGPLFSEPGFAVFVLPMWVMAAGIVLTVSATANGALVGFDHMAGLAVALYFCAQSVIVSLVGTLSVAMLNGDTIWPLVAYAAGMPAITLAALALLDRRKRV